MLNTYIDHIRYIVNDFCVKYHRKVATLKALCNNCNLVIEHK